MAKKRVMVVDDDKNIRNLIVGILSKFDYDIVQVSNGEAGLKRLEEGGADCVLLDLQLPGMDGIETLKAIKKQYEHLPVIIMTAHGTIEKAVSSMKLGSYDFVEKPFIPGDRLRVTVQKALETTELEVELRNLRSELKNRTEFVNIIGQSGIMQELFKSVEKIIDSDVTVLIQGESGTGKELFARAIHNQCKARNQAPFVAVNCTAIPESLLESELFGHEKGSFTGAAARRLGKFEQANGGTVFLDEIGDMSLATQAKILRVLQEREFERVGGNTLVKVNIRLISASNKSLEEEVRKGGFREDLFYRISVFPIKLPPLRERRSDIPLLVARFIQRYGEREKKKVTGIRPDALKVLSDYHWPGNVRELENAIERAVVIAAAELIRTEDLPPHIVMIGKERFADSIDTSVEMESLPEWIEKLEIDILRKTLLEFEGNIAQAAKKLGIGRATIYRKAKKYHLPISR
jgi:DNA-binding NtrC family response regulator